ncbi:hypothetical protein J7E62_15050 [Variovorax paradoxus]|nr:hypothetical protein [Variovorax paradoxus]
MVRAPRRRLLLCASRPSLGALGELVQAWRDAAVDVEIETFDSKAPDLVALVAGADRRLDAALLVGSARRAPATVLPAPFAAGRDGKRVPIAWMPARDTASLRRFAATAARVQNRACARSALALLGQWLPRYLHVTQRLCQLADDGRVRAFRWTGDAMTRDSMISALGCGIGLGLYVGHGRSMGWVGYHGVRAHHFDDAGARCGVDVVGASAPMREPMGAILSLCCRTASRRRVALSYAEAIPLSGVAAASFGAVGDTLYSDNTRWAVGVCDALAQGASTVGELLVHAAPASQSALASYRLIGDPLAPLGCSEQALRRAQHVRTYE